MSKDAQILQFVKNHFEDESKRFALKELVLSKDSRVQSAWQVYESDKDMADLVDTLSRLAV